MRLSTYLRRGRVFIPTLGLVQKGLYRDIEPVSVIDVTATDPLRQALWETFSRGNPPTGPYPRPYPPPVIVKHAGVKRWGDFARGASTWTIDERDGSYKIVGYRREPNNWAEDPAQEIRFPSGTIVNNVIDRMTSILQNAARQDSDL
jgi:hypothetical protein